MFQDPLTTKIYNKICDKSFKDLHITEYEQGFEFFIDSKLSMTLKILPSDLQFYKEL